VSNWVLGVVLAGEGSIFVVLDDHINGLVVSIDTGDVENSLASFLGINGEFSS